jgi:N-acetylglucosamine-6-sulfatase
VRSGPSGRRAAGAALLALAALGAAVVVPRPAAVRSDDRPNVIVVLTDDQRAGTFAQMPWLGSQLARVGSGWTEFPNAFANTPLCCPARASLLTGLYARHTGVLDNGDGDQLDASATLATWLHDAGYRTGLVGKYLNTYPFGRLPFIPPGWDRFVAKENQTGVTVYRDFHAVDQGSPVFVRRYATDWLAERAIDFVRTAPPTQPFFLLFAPSAPHPPWIPAARHEGAFAGLRVEEPPTVAGALRGAPPWVRSLPFPSAAQRAAWLDDQRRADETLLAVDEALRALVTTLGDRLDDTVIFVLSDNGYSFGEHRWEGKTCPYDACVRIPLAVYTPDARLDPEDAFVSIVDLAPTILDLAGAPRVAGRDGTSFAARLDASGGPHARPDPVFLEWAGDDRIPAWRSIRTADFTLIRYADGFEELYDLRGRLGPADPWESINRARDLLAAGVAQRLRTLLGRVLGPD